jgi:hypothetical protein
VRKKDERRGEKCFIYRKQLNHAHMQKLATRVEQEDWPTYASSRDRFGVSKSSLLEARKGNTRVIDSVFEPRHLAQSQLLFGELNMFV